MNTQDGQGGFVRKLLFLATLFICLPTLSSEGNDFPSQLSGTWSDSERTIGGNAEITLTRNDAEHFEGTMFISGAYQCPSPIPIAGEVRDSRVIFYSTRYVVCGFPGKVRGEVALTDPGTYSGTFEYRLRFFNSLVYAGSFSLTRKAQWTTCPTSGHAHFLCGCFFFTNSTVPFLISITT